MEIASFIASKPKIKACDSKSIFFTTLYIEKLMHVVMMYSTISAKRSMLSIIVKLMLLESVPVNLQFFTRRFVRKQPKLIGHSYDQQSSDIFLSI